MRTELESMEDFDRLSAFLKGKVLSRIAYLDSCDNVDIWFSDGTHVVISTIGGLEVEKVEVDNGHIQLP